MALAMLMRRYEFSLDPDAPEVGALLQLPLRLGRRNSGKRGSTGLGAASTHAATARSTQERHSCGSMEGASSCVCQLLGPVVSLKDSSGARHRACTCLKGGGGASDATAPLPS